MNNRNVQIFEFGFRWPLLVPFIAVTVGNGGNPSTYYKKLTA